MNVLDKPCWFVLFTMPNHEKIVYQNLKRKGIEAFLPLRKEIRQWSDRKKRVEAPLFPNYLFVRIPKIHRFKVFDVPGIVRFLDSNKNATVISEEEISIVQRVINEDFEVTEETFLRGDPVMITVGPLKNVKGELVHRKGRQRLLVQIQSIKRHLLIDISPSHLQKIVPMATHFCKQGQAGARVDRMAISSGQ